MMIGGIRPPQPANDPQAAKAGAGAQSAAEFPLGDGPSGEAPNVQ
jgi:hypothetical protein